MKVRAQVLQTMLQFRAQGEIDVSRWRTILSENILFTLPVTPYRSFPPVEVSGNQRSVVGIHAFISDTASFHMMIQTLAGSHSVGYDRSNRVMVQFIVDQKDMIINENQLICKTTLQSLNAVELGARHEIRVPIMMRALYSHLNKLTELNFIFDVMSLMQQLRRSSSKHDFQVNKPN